MFRLRGGAKERMMSASNFPLRQFLSLTGSRFSDATSKLSPWIALPSTSLKSSSNIIGLLYV